MVTLITLIDSATCTGPHINQERVIFIITKSWFPAWFPCMVKQTKRPPFAPYPFLPSRPDPWRFISRLVHARGRATSARPGALRLASRGSPARPWPRRGLWRRGRHRLWRLACREAPAEGARVPRAPLAATAARAPGQAKQRIAVIIRDTPATQLTTGRDQPTPFSQESAHPTDRRQPDHHRMADAYDRRHEDLRQPGGIRRG
jgi:hypothetical protein